MNVAAAVLCGAVRRARRRVPQRGGRAHARQGPARGDARGRRGPDPVARACPCSRGSSGAAHGTSASPRWLAVELVTVGGVRRRSARAFGDTEAVLPLLVLGAALVAVSRGRPRAPTASPTASRSPPSALAAAAARGRVARPSTSPGRSGARPVGRRRVLRDPAPRPPGLPAGHGLRRREAGAADGPVPRLGGADVTGPPVAEPLRLVLYALVLGCLLGVVFGLVHRAVTKAPRGFPFGPALARGLPGRRSSSTRPVTSDRRTRSSSCAARPGGPVAVSKDRDPVATQAALSAWLGRADGAPSVEVGQVGDPGPVRVLERDPALRRHLGRRRRARWPTRS